ncbi:hypothetical protein [Algibacter aquimarinus]|uniref:Thioredoxin family protein n=1 Tax=Algibacter aquimarinus TaxID=1136748 RepID=A0ABP9HM42_9FLAO
MKLYLYIILSSIILLGCKKTTNDTDGEIAYLGGEIINPNNRYIILSKAESVVDTIDLDGRNRFMYKVKNLEEGLYTFKHGGEFQMILLEPNDSILIRLNTLDFDESLVYTGIGAKKNNYFINDFLENEKIERDIYQYCQLSANDYNNKIDSLKSVKTSKLAAFQDKYETSDLFNKIAETNNKYTYYFSKEVYPLWHYTNNKFDIYKTLPEGFYDYRNEINYNDEFLKDNFIYNTFLKSNFNNLALQKHFEHSNSGDLFKRMSLCYHLDRLNLIDSLVVNNKIKDDLLYHFTVSYIARSNNYDNNEAVLSSYLSKSNNDKGKEMMTRFTNSLNNLKVGSQLPDVTIVNYNNSELDINSIIEKPTVISFWSHTFYNHFKKSHYKINSLKKKYPEVNFIVINIDDYGLEKSKKSLQNNRFSSNNEYYFKNPEKSIEVLAIHPMTKAMIIDKDKKIVNSNTNMFSIKFEEQLLGLINR